MNTELLARTGQLRQRQKDVERVKSILGSAAATPAVVKRMQLDESSATVIFREMYESIRQLGDPNWWLLGYEPLNHDVSMEILMEMDVREKTMLNNMARFRRIRNDANYRGYKVLVSQAREILDFWDKCGNEILKALKKEAEY